MVLLYACSKLKIKSSQVADWFLRLCQSLRPAAWEQQQQWQQLASCCSLPLAGVDVVSLWWNVAHLETAVNACPAKGIRNNWWVRVPYISTNHFHSGIAWKSAFEQHNILEDQRVLRPATIKCSVRRQLHRKVFIRMKIEILSNFLLTLFLSYSWSSPLITSRFDQCSIRVSCLAWGHESRPGASQWPGDCLELQW